MHRYLMVFGQTPQGRRTTVNLLGQAGNRYCQTQCRAEEKVSLIMVKSFPKFPWARDTREMMYNHPSHVTVQEKVGYKHSGRIIQPRRMKS